MRARIRKWGNSLALRIPKSFAAEASLKEESVVDATRRGWR
jgi:antitoxin MazE